MEGIDSYKVCVGMIESKKTESEITHGKIME